jgi:signal transduction histidine kinase
VGGLLYAAELERSQLAKFIHDDVLQTLGTALMAADTAEQASRRGRSDMLPDQLARQRTLLEDTATALRSLMAELRPYEPGPGGLRAALSSIFGAYQERTGATVTWSLAGEVALGGLGELLAYRTALELLPASHDRSNATNVELTIGVDAGIIRIDATLTPAAPAGAAVRRLAPARVSVLRWRVQALGGSLEQTDAPGSTRIQVEAPIPS